MKQHWKTEPIDPSYYLETKINWAKMPKKGSAQTKWLLVVANIVGNRSKANHTRRLSEN